MQVLGKLSGPNKATVEVDKLAKVETNKVPVDQTTSISLCCKKKIKSDSRWEHLNGWKVCNGCHQSKMLKS
jgi:hypothetical protein